MPTAVATINVENNIYLYFNDTLDETAILQKDDVQLAVFGPKNSYNFDWKLEFLNNNTVFIETSFTSSLVGNNQEKMQVHFINRDKFKSIFSKRGVAPNDLTDCLYKFEGVVVSSKSLGQTAMIIFLASVSLSLISSFGGNSMEMMWNFMNTLQIMFFLSYVFVKHPGYVNEFFSYLAYSNLENKYLEYLTLSLISSDKFTRGNVNSQIGPKAFYISAADKIPFLISLLVIFIITIVSDIFKLSQKGK